jgi:hypothetical protein
MNGKADLLEVIGALGASCCLASGLYSGQEQRDKNSNDGDDHQELDQREPPEPRAILGQDFHGGTPSIKSEPRVRCRRLSDNSIPPGIAII